VTIRAEVGWVAWLAVLAAFTALVEASTIVRLPVGLLAALVLPGYAVCLLLFRPGDLGGIDRFALAIPVSLASVMVGALLLDRTPMGLDPTMIVVATSVFTLAVVSSAWRRWRDLEPPTQPPPSGQVGRTARLIARLGASAVAVGLLSLVISLNDQAPQSTELYVLDGQGTTEGYPAEIRPGERISLRVGINHRESTPASYRVVVQADGRRVAEIGPIDLPPQGGWSGPLLFALTTTRDNQEIMILLLRGTQDDPIRTLRLWANVTGTT
jgi:uncharacterized membrane protein